MTVEASSEPSLVPPSFSGSGGSERSDEDEVVAHPSRIIRLASMAQALLSEIDGIELDEAARHRLAAVFNLTVERMRELLSDELKDELDALRFHVPADASEAELRLAQAQLVGWLEGLFHGIRTAVIAHNLATQEELSAAYHKGLEQARREAEKSQSRHYL